MGTKRFTVGFCIQVFPVIVRGRPCITFELFPRETTVCRLAYCLLFQQFWGAREKQRSGYLSKLMRALIQAAISLPAICHSRTVSATAEGTKSPSMNHLLCSIQKVKKKLRGNELKEHYRSSGSV